MSQTIGANLFAFFLRENSDLVDIIVGNIENSKDKNNVQVQYLHCDKTGENVVFKKACKQEGLVVDFEFTALGMPQQNGCI